MRCFGLTDGDVFISVTSGSPPYSYLWSNSATIEDLINVAIGTYTVTVTDFNGCTQTITQSVTEPDSIGISFISSNEICNQANGTIDANVTGGVQPYSYLWSTASTGNSISNLTAGSYT
ncbi:MAG: SprB repeat-containing protein, partial [Bacteroidia bacterium]